MPRRWPGGRSVAVYVAIDSGRSTGVATTGRRDQARWRYGLASGMRFMLEHFSASEIPATVIVEPSMCAIEPDLLTTFRQRDDELVVDLRQSGPSEPGRNGLEAFCQATAGKSLRGCLVASPDAASIPDEPVPSIGSHYRLEWLPHDHPQWTPVGTSSVLSLPWPLELDDGLHIVDRDQAAGGFERTVAATIEQQLRRPVDRVRVIGIRLHPSIMGMPHRLPALSVILDNLDRRRDEVWLCHTGEVASFLAL